jgi:hypothetical protein
MACPPEIARILLAIIQTATLHIRAAGWSGDAKRCAAEADHIHNLPGLVADYSQEGLRYYWQVEKPSYERLLDRPPTSFQPLWDELGGLVDQAPVTRAS